MRTNDTIQCNDVTMSMMLKNISLMINDMVTVWWQRQPFPSRDNNRDVDNILSKKFKPSRHNIRRLTFPRRKYSYSWWRWWDNNVKGSAYFSIMTWWQQWWNKAKGCLFRNITSIFDNYNRDDIDTDKIVTRILIMVVMVMKMMNITIMMLGDGRDKQCWKVHKEAVSNF